MLFKYIECILHDGIILQIALYYKLYRVTTCGVLQILHYHRLQLYFIKDCIVSPVVLHILRCVEDYILITASNFVCL